MITIDGATYNPTIEKLNFITEKQNEYVFYRRKVDQEMIFFREDYDRLLNNDFDHKFEITITGDNFNDYDGYFYYTDLKINYDDEIITIKNIETYDSYEDLIGGLNKEYNIIPELTEHEVEIQIYNALQFLIEGDTKLVTFYGTKIYYEEIDSYTNSQLINDYNFTEFQIVKTSSDTNVNTASDYLFARYLTDADVFNGSYTDDRPSDDLSSLFQSYDKTAIVLEENFTFINSVDHSDVDEGYGLVASCSGSPSGFGPYYKKPDIGIAISDIGRPLWNCYSYWVVRDSLDIVADDNGTKTLDGFLVSDVINKMLELIGSDLTHDETCSEFLYDENPMTERTINHVIIPKSNAIKLVYDKAATIGRLKFNDLIFFLENVYKCYFYINGTKLHFEHISYFENTLSYDNSVVTTGIDITTEKRVKSNKNLEEGYKKINFNKVELPEEINCKWTDETSLEFNSYPIKINSNYVAKGNVDEIIISRFSTDIDYFVQNESVNKDGFIWVEIDSSDVVEIYDEILDNRARYIQNGYLTWSFIHENYWKNDLPAKNVNLNNKDVTAFDITRKQEQRINMPFVDIGYYDKIKTSFDYANIKSINHDVYSNQADYVLSYRTDNDFTVGVVSGFRAIEIDVDSILLTWDTVNIMNGYELQYSLNEVKWTDLNPTTNGYSHTSLNSDTVYYYRVRTIGAGITPNSDWVYLTLKTLKYFTWTNLNNCSYASNTLTATSNNAYAEETMPLNDGDFIQFQLNIGAPTDPINNNFLFYIEDDSSPGTPSTPFYSLGIFKDTSEYIDIKFNGVDYYTLYQPASRIVRIGIDSDRIYLSINIYGNYDFILLKELPLGSSTYTVRAFMFTSGTFIYNAKKLES